MHWNAFKCRFTFIIIEFPTGKRIFKINSRTQAVMKNIFSQTKLYLYVFIYTYLSVIYAYDTSHLR